MKAWPEKEGIIIFHSPSEANKWSEEKLRLMGNNIKFAALFYDYNFIINEECLISTTDV